MSFKSKSWKQQSSKEAKAIAKHFEAEKKTRFSIAYEFI